MTGHWLAIARKDFQYTRRSNVLIGIIATFAIMTVGIVAVPGVIAMLTDASVSEIDSLGLIRATASAAGFIIPITALVGAYLAIAGERESGRIRLLLSMPPSRRDMVIGKFVSRSGVILLAIAIAYALAIVSSLLLYQDVALQDTLTTMLLVGLLGVTFVGIGVGISAFATSRARAIALVLVFYMFAIVLWDPAMLAAGELLSEFGNTEEPAWLALVETISPSSAFSALYNETVGAVFGTNYESDAFYRTIPGLLGIMVGWVVGALALGYAVFERADLS